MTPPRRVLVTGANGFVGRALCALLSTQGWHVRLGVHHSQATGDFVRHELGPGVDWQAALAGMDYVVHLAARVHVPSKSDREALAAFRHVNVEGTRCLAEAAAAQRVRRFVFLSSIKVNGESTSASPFSESDEPHPVDAYGRSKHEAEKALSDVVDRTGLDVTILRPPLIYGPGVKANFLRLIQLCARGAPLPLASIENSRSLLYLGNLTHAIMACLEHPMAAGKTYLISDAQPVSTPQLVRAISEALHVRPRLFGLPASLSGLGAALLGKRDYWDRLASSLQIDASKIRTELDWHPPYTMAQGLGETARWYHSR